MRDILWYTVPETFSVSACSTFCWREHEAERTSWLEAKMLNGVYLGLRLGTNEMYIGIVKGVIRAAPIKRTTESERSEMVMVYQQQGIPSQRAVARIHCQCSWRCAAVKAESSAHAKSTSVQVWKSRGMGRLQVVKDATPSRRGAQGKSTAQRAERIMTEVPNDERLA